MIKLSRTQAHEDGTNVMIHIGIQFLILHLEYAFYNALLQFGEQHKLAQKTCLIIIRKYKLAPFSSRHEVCNSNCLCSPLLFISRRPT